MTTRHTLIGLTIAAIAAALVAGPAAASTTKVKRTASVRYPASALILGRTVAAHVAPSSSSKTLTVFRQFRSDFRPTVLLVLGEKRSSGGVRWLEISVPGRPNGQRGWVRAKALDLRPVSRTIVVDLSARKLRVLEDGKTRFATRVAVGKRGAETPTGLFHVTATFVPTEKYLGVHAFETSAYSKLSDWPGGGVVGLHGTNMPQLLGQAISHGCVRMSNAAARTLGRLVQAGTPLRVVQ